MTAGPPRGAGPRLAAGRRRCPGLLRHGNGGRQGRTRGLRGRKTRKSVANQSHASASRGDMHSNMGITSSINNELVPTIKDNWVRCAALNDFKALCRNKADTGGRNRPTSQINEVKKESVVKGLRHARRVVPRSLSIGALTRRVRFMHGLSGASKLVQGV